MALDPSSNPTMAGRITPADADFPYGSSQNESAPGAGDGTPYFKGRADDVFGFQQWLLTTAGIVPTGTADNVNASQYGEALRAIFGNVGLTVLTASGTYNPPDNAKALLVFVAGGGGGSGGTEARSGGEGSSSAGGGAGATAVIFIPKASLSASYTVTVGAAGTAGLSTPSAGGSGGTSIFTDGSFTATANGGAGGAPAFASSSGVTENQGGVGGTASVSSGTYFTIPGAGGGDGSTWEGVPVSLGNGGGALFGPAAFRRNVSQTPGNGYGGGGAGIQRSPTAGSGFGAIGAPGAPGAVIILEFYQL